MNDDQFREFMHALNKIRSNIGWLAVVGVWLIIVIMMAAEQIVGVLT